MGLPSIRHWTWTESVIQWTHSTRLRGSGKDGLVCPSSRSLLCGRQNMLLMKAGVWQLTSENVLLFASLIWHFSGSQAATESCDLARKAPYPLPFPSDMLFIYTKHQCILEIHLRYRSPSNNNHPTNSLHVEEARKKKCECNIFTH